MTILSLFISNNYRTGGQKRFIDLLTGLMNKGHSVVLLKREGRDLPLDDHKNVTTIEIPVRGKGSQNLLFLKGIKRTLKENKTAQKNVSSAEIILQFGESTRSSVAWLRKQFSLPSLIAIRNNWVEAERNLYKHNNCPIARVKGFLSEIRGRIVERSAAKAAEFLVFQSDYDRKSFLSRNGFPEDDTAIIHNSLQAGWFDPQWMNSNTNVELKRILFIGNEDPRKGYDVLLSALNSIKKNQKFNYLELIFIGRFSRNLKTALKIKYSFADPQFIGIQENIFPQMKNADLLVVPSYYDSFPNTVLEALHSGLLVVGSDVAGISVMLKGTGLLFPPGETEKCKEIIKNLIDKDNYIKAKNICNKRRDFFAFSWYDEWEKLLRNQKSPERSYQ